MKEFTEDEKTIAKNIDKKYKWIARDSNGWLYLYQNKPNKLDCCWDDPNNSTPYRIVNLKYFNHIFISIKWEDDEPTRISDIYIEQILDDVEREYLKKVLKPFHDKVKHIVKFDSYSYNKRYLFILFNDNSSFSFPDFDDDKMYSGMELEKRYTLEELGITYDD